MQSGFVCASALPLAFTVYDKVRVPSKSKNAKQKWKNIQVHIHI